MNPEKGKQNYIRIESISDIDPNKLSISQIHQRFVDKDNNRYALRFNKETRRIEIIKITTHQGVEIASTTGVTPPVPAPQIPVPNKLPNQVLKETSQATVNPLQDFHADNERSALPTQAESSAPEEALLGGDTDLDIMGVESAHRDSTESKNMVDSSVNSNGSTETRSASQLVEHFIKVLGVYKERANAVIRNLQSSRIFEVTGDPSENKNIVGNLSREFEAQVFEVMDKMVDLHKEMTSYPRPINYYISKAPLDIREQMKLVEPDKEKLNQLHLFEMRRFTENIIIGLKALSLQLINVLNIKTETQVKQLQYPNQLMYLDAKNASLYFSQDLDKTLLEIENWKNQK